MTAIDAVASSFRQYATFRGRARRSEFWWFALFTLVLGLVTSSIDTAFFTPPVDEAGPVTTVGNLVTLVPGLAVSWRRLHDTGRTGWWILVLLVPVVGWIVYLVLLCSNSHPRSNRFGPSPKHQDPWPWQAPAAPGNG